MFKTFFSLSTIISCNFGLLWLTANKAVAQVTTDSTTGTEVNENGSGSEITGGEARGDNLFHSFEDFSVSTGSEAFFNNASDIANIFSRVTGGNLSNIDGTIRTNDASLFLVNPAGILFGAGAKLDLGGGSFYGSTADSILFEGGEFSAVDLDNPPLLTVNAPIGFSFRDEPAEIINRSTVDGVGLEVAPGATIGLIGGDVNIEGGLVTAPGGLVELGGLSESGTVSFAEDDSLSFPEEIDKSNVELIDDANVTVADAGGGFINVNANNFVLLGGSELIAGIAEDMGTTGARAGDIRIIAESIEIVGFDAPNAESTTNPVLQTGIRNNIGDRTIVIERAENPEQNLTSTAVGDGGAIEIETKVLSIEQNGKVSTTGFGTGNVGDVNIVSENISLGSGSIESFSRDGGVGDAGSIAIANSDEIVLQSSAPSAFAGIQNQVFNDAQGNVGNIDIDTGSITLAEFSIIQTDTRGEVTGNAGNITIEAQESVILDGNGSPSLIFAEIQEGGVGNAGDIGINANVLAVRNGAEIAARTNGQGDAGNISITTSDSISLENNSRLISSVAGNATGNGGNIKIETDGSLFSTGGNLISAESQATGDSGNITITAGEEIVVEGFNQGNFPTIIFAGLFGDNANGTGGNVDINAGELSLKDVATIAANNTTGSIGSAGNITINVDRLSLAENAFINAFTANDFDSGSVTVNAQTLNLASGGKIVAATDSGGNAGNINLNVGEQINIDNSVKSSATFVNFGDESELINNLQSSPSGIYANTTENADGNGGNVNISALPGQTLETAIANDARLVVNSEGTGSGGNISIESQNLELSNNGTVSASTNSGRGGLINLDLTENLILSDNSLISAQAFNNADGGNVEIDSQFVIAFNEGNNDILASAEQGTGGNININAESLFGIEERPANDLTNDIDASSEFSLDGNVNVNILNFDPIKGTTELPTNIVQTQSTVAQTCSNNRAIADNSLTIQGRSGVPASPELPLSSGEILTEGDRISNIPAPIETGKGNIQPARGIKMNADGSIVLTAYQTDSLGRIAPSGGNCSL